MDEQVTTLRTVPSDTRLMTQHTAYAVERSISRGEWLTHSIHDSEDAARLIAADLAPFRARVRQFNY